MIVRRENARDFDDIRRINIEAFSNHPFSQQTEHLIVEALRDAGALEFPFVAEEDGEVVGYVAFSAAQIGEASSGWYLLGPLAVLPERQGHGIGGTLVEAGLDALRAHGACGCALVGDPRFYERFGFKHYAGLTCHGVPDDNVLALAISGDAPRGEIVHHPAFLTGM